jgi:hypothetical protein
MDKLINPVGLQVTMLWQGRMLLGDVRGVSPEHGCIALDVRHFNGEPWPIMPCIFEVNILERTYAAADE